jgi:hypothetical protein
MRLKLNVHPKVSLGPTDEFMDAYGVASFTKRFVIFGLNIQNLAEIL